MGSGGGRRDGPFASEMTYFLPQRVHRIDKIANILQGSVIAVLLATVLYQSSESPLNTLMNSGY